MPYPFRTTQSLPFEDVGDEVVGVLELPVYESLTPNEDIYIASHTDGYKLPEELIIDFALMVQKARRAIAIDEPIEEIVNRLYNGNQDLQDWISQAIPKKQHAYLLKLHRFQQRQDAAYVGAIITSRNGDDEWQFDWGLKDSSSRPQYITWPFIEAIAVFAKKEQSGGATSHQHQEKEPFSAERIMKILNGERLQHRTDWEDIYWQVQWYWPNDPRFNADNFGFMPITTIMSALKHGKILDTQDKDDMTMLQSQTLCLQANANRDLKKHPPIEPKDVQPFQKILKELKGSSTPLTAANTVRSLLKDQKLPTWLDGLLPMDELLEAKVSGNAPNQNRLWANGVAQIGLINPRIVGDKVRCDMAAFEDGITDQQIPLYDMDTREKVCTIQVYGNGEACCRTALDSAGVEFNQVEIIDYQG